MTSITLTDEQLDRLAADLADRVAVRLADRLAAPAAETAAPRLVDAAELAELLGVARSTVYEHAEELGGRRLGVTERSPDKKHRGGSRLRFDVDQALVAWTARSGSERSDAENANGDGPPAQPDSRAPRRRVAGLPKPGTVLTNRGRS